MLPVPHLPQRNSADCLAACAAMLLQYNGIQIDYAEVLSLLDIGPIGAPRRYVTRLSRLGISVDYREANLALLLDYLTMSVPVIAFVDTGELPYWTVATNHAVVVIGYQEDELLVNDPALQEAPQRVHLEEFELAWLNSDYMCAIFSKI